MVNPLLKDKYKGKGDIANETGFLDFPENLNVLAFKLEPYLKILQETKGLVSEFLNPKYSDESRTKFKSPTRLECLMQDVLKLIKHGEIVGYTYFDRGFCFSACKNNLLDAIEKLKKMKRENHPLLLREISLKQTKEFLKKFAGN